MMDIDLERDWRTLAVGVGSTCCIKLSDAYDECLGRIGKRGTVFELFTYFAKTEDRRRRIERLRISASGHCFLMTSSGPGGFAEIDLGPISAVPERYSSHKLR